MAAAGNSGFALECTDCGYLQAATEAEARTDGQTCESCGSPLMVGVVISTCGTAKNRQCTDPTHNKRTGKHSPGYVW